MKTLATLVLAMLASVGGHAGPIDDMKRYDQLNDACRGGRGADPATEVACTQREALGAKLQRQNICYNPRSATPREAWKVCHPEAAMPTAPRVARPMTVEQALDQCAAGATQADTVTRLRDTMVPKRYVLDWGYPPAMVDAIYAGRAYSYRGAAYCYSLENIERVRAQLGTM